MRSKNFEIKTDCFAFKSNHTCSALKALYCAKENCKFYKRKEYSNGLLQSKNR